MAVPTAPVSEHQTVDFKTKCTMWLRKAEQQKVRAIEMSKRAHQMCDLAAQMRKGPNPAALSGRV